MIKHIITRYHNYQIKSYKEYDNDILVWYENFDEDGNKHGMSYAHCNNVKSYCQYVHGRKHGKYRLWYSNGDKCVECNYVDGLINGIYNFYTKEGLYQTTEFVNGLKNGLLLTYNVDGSLYRKEIYKNNKLIKHTRYPENDKINYNSI